MRNALGAWHPRAGSRTVEGEAVVAAFHVVTLDASHGERQFPMRTGILEGGGPTVLLAVKDDVFAEYRNGLQLAADFVVPGCNVPGILEKHFALLAFC
ncbi:hypothetical protein D9M68_977820 [compost metagenome]